MALTDAQKAKIRSYLGYSAVYGPSDTYRHNRNDLDQAMAVIDAEAELLVEADLALIDTLWGQFTSSSGIVAKAGLKRVDDIEFYQGGQVKDFRSVGGALVDKLAAYFGVPKAGDIFGSGGLCGGVIPLG